MPVTNPRATHGDSGHNTLAASSNSIGEIEAKSPPALSNAAKHETSRPPTTWQKIYDVLSYTPPWCRYDPKSPPKFSMSLNILFGFAATFTVANLYYAHPILNILARDFGVSDEQASNIPTAAQAGYATGLMFLCPLGDLLKRRPFVLWLMLLTATLWYDFHTPM